MPEPGGSFVRGLESGANIAGFTKGTASSYITSSTWLHRQHGGSDDVDNLALACHRYNLHKGPNLSGVDPLTGAVEILFHPRRDHWPKHFAFRGAYLEGVTPAGRVTVEVLALNDARRIELRQELLALGDLT